MKAKFKYINFVQVHTPPNRRTTIWNCCHERSGVVLGQVRWYSRWRRYCYFPNIQAIYSAECLRDIDAFIGQLHADRKASAKALKSKAR